MFKEFFKKAFRSRKTLSDEKVEELEEAIERLTEDTKLREAQIIKFVKLLQQDPINKDKYAKRLIIHQRIIRDNKQKIEELEIKLLDK